MTTDTVKPADAGVLREVATDLEHWGPPANDNGARAARLSALAEVLQELIDRSQQTACNCRMCQHVRTALAGILPLA